MGAPTKLTPERRDKILEYLRTGVAIEVATRASGIEPQTHYNWFNRGRPRGIDDEQHTEEDAIYVEYFEAVIRARAERESYLAGLIVRQASDDWRAAAWMLERGVPERWAKRTEITGVAGGPVELRAVPAQPVDADAVSRMTEVMERAQLLNSQPTLDSDANIARARGGLREGLSEMRDDDLGLSYGDGDGNGNGQH